MKYSLALFAKEDYKIIDNFNKIPDYEDSDCHSLKDIINFTTTFIDEEDMMDYLATSGLIEEKGCNWTF